MQKIKAVIFDLDGTLANTLPLCIAAFRKSIEPIINRPVSDQEIIETFGPSEEGTIMALAPTHYEEGVATYLQHYETLHQMCPNPFEGIRELLVVLQNRSIRLAMVTGKGKFSTDISLKYLGLDHFFEMIETGWVNGPRKADGIQNVLNQWVEIEKGEVLYIGDAPSDIEASRKVGICVIAAAWAETAEPQKLKPLQPNEIFYSVGDFENWLLTKI